LGLVVVHGGVKGSLVTAVKKRKMAITTILSQEEAYGRG
jgi:hypothetical protein